MDNSDLLTCFSQAAAIIDPDLLIVDVNSAFLKITRLKKDEVLQKPLPAVFRMNNALMDSRKKAKNLIVGKVNSFSLGVSLPGGVKSDSDTFFKVNFQGLAHQKLLLGFFTEGNKPQSGSHPDVSDQHLFKLLLNQLPDAIYFKDIEGRFFLTNRLHAKKLGFKDASEFIGKSDFDLFSQEHAQQAFDDEQHVIKTGETISKEEKETHFDGSETWATTSKMLLRNELGQAIGTFGISKDITQIKNAEIQLRKAEKILQETNDAKDKFFSILAHDLKNPFNSLLGLSELLVEDFDETSEEEKLDMLKKIQRTSESAYALLENLLDWARMQTGSISLNIQTVELFPVIKNVLEVNYLHAYNKQIEIINEVQEDIKVMADENMLLTMIRNLVSNAIKFTNREGKVWIRSILENDRVRIIVEDNGIGMDDKTRGRLFKISEKVKTYGTDDESGTGLGLIIIKEFIEKNNGTITVESTPGKGSRFVIVLPGQ